MELGGEGTALHEGLAMRLNTVVQAGKVQAGFGKLISSIGVEGF
jgi:hypothetical protein